MKINGSQIVIECLVEQGVDTVFGYPGGVVLPLYDALYLQSDIKHYLVRHEQAAVHAAEGYARVTSKPAVAIVTSGPGACNTVTGLANAYYDGTPLILITGQVNSKLIGNDAFQEADIVGITRSCCKHNYLVKDVRDLARIIKEAFYIATTGKKGPVVIDIPVDVFSAKCTFEYPKQIELVGYNPNYVLSTIHCNKYNNGGTPIESAGRSVPTAQSEYHIYACEWTADYLRFFVDGSTILTYKNDGTGKDAWPFNAPFYLKLNLAWGGNWGGDMGVDDSALPATYKIDYVRVYQKK